MVKKEKRVKKVKRVNPNPGTSTFDGGLWSLIGWRLLFGLSACTLFIATPWVECAFHRWVARHTKINGKQLVFDGKGGQLFWKNVGWFLLSIIPPFIFILWLPIKKQKWIMKHTYIEETQETNNWYANYPAMPQFPQPPQVPQMPQQPAPYCAQYYYPCAPQAPVYPQGGCCRYR